jgi:hypothetical protein
LNGHYFTGLQLAAETGTWLPWSEVYNCDKNEKNCKAKGFNFELFKVLGNTFNFTFTMSQTPLTNWGVTPVTGAWSDANATFSGKHIIV